MTELRRIMIAAAIAPLSAPIAAIVAIVFLGAPNSDLMWKPAFMVGVAISYVVFFLIGMPTVLVLRRCGVYRPKNVVYCGIGIGLAIGAALLLFVFPDSEGTLLLNAWIVLLPGLYGLLVSACFVALAFARMDVKDA